MSYVPPVGRSIVVELAEGAAYAPPLGRAIVVDLFDTGGATGTVEFVNTNGALALVGYPPTAATVAYALSTTASMALSGYAPSSHITRSNLLSSPGALTLSGYVPSISSTQVSQISTYGALSLAVLQPTYFRGKTQQIVETANLVMAGNSGISTYRHSFENIPAGSLTLTAEAIKQVMQILLDTTGAMSFTAQPAITHKLTIRSEIISKYYTPDVTLSSEGVLGMAGYPPSYGLKVASGMEAIYGLMHLARSAITAVYTGKIASGVASSYAVRGAVVSGVLSPYTVKNTETIAASVVSGYRMPISSQIVAPYSLRANVAIRAAVISSYAVIANVSVRAAVISPYSAVSNTLVRGSIASTYTYQTAIINGIHAPYSMTLPVAAEIRAFYDLENLLYARSGVQGIYSMPDSQVINIVEAPYLEYLGNRIDIQEAELSIAEEEYAWKATLVLARVTDYTIFKQDQPFAVVIGTERYEFIVDSKEMDRSNPANYTMKLLGISPSAKLSSPRHVATSYLWDTYVTASEVAEELVPGIDWQVIDWAIPAYRLAVQDSTPIGVLKVLLSAIGATIESNIDGTLRARSLYPVSVQDYATTTPDHILLETIDILRVNESYVSADTYNRLIITDVSQDIADSLEWIPDYNAATTGVMRAFLYPWRSSVALLHTGESGVSIEAPYLGMEEHEEIIEVFQGAAQTEYPIHHITSVEYESTDVGSIVFDVDSRSFTVGGPSFNSVIRLVYWARSLDYRVSLPTAKPTQFLLESEPL